MPKLVTVARRCLIARMRAAGISQRRAAELARTCRNTVHQVDKRRRPTEEDPAGVAALLARWPAGSEYTPQQRVVEPYKCRCGYVVVLKPCVICLAKQAKLRTRLSI